jgi:hypothetical protein
LERAPREKRRVGLQSESGKGVVSMNIDQMFNS